MTQASLGASADQVADYLVHTYIRPVHDSRRCKDGTAGYALPYAVPALARIKRIGTAPRGRIAYVTLVSSVALAACALLYAVSVK